MNEKDEKIAEVINGLADRCYKISSVSGFHEDYFKMLTVLGQYTEEKENDFTLLKWFDEAAEQAEVARMHSELSEWVEGIRHSNPADQHLTHLSSAEVEAADCIIRILDTCAKRNYNIGKALLEKIEYNRTRPYKHGKNS